MPPRPKYKFSIGQSENNPCALAIFSLVWTPKESLYGPPSSSSSSIRVFKLVQPRYAQSPYYQSLAVNTIEKSFGF